MTQLPYPQPAGSGGMTQPAEPPPATTGNVITHTTTNLPESNIGWAVVSVVFFWPLAFSAFTNAWKVFPLWSAGDSEGAAQAAAKTKLLGKISLLVGLIVLLVFIIVKIVWACWFFHHYGHGGFGHHHGGFAVTVPAN